MSFFSYLPFGIKVQYYKTFFSAIYDWQERLLSQTFLTQSNVKLHSAWPHSF